MKRHFVLVALAVASISAAAGCASPAEEEETTAASEEALTSWQNILNINVPAAGYINTLSTPHLTLRPVRGRYLKMSWPAHCNAQITSMALYGTSLQGQRLPVSAVLAGGPQLEASGSIATYYSVNSGLGATVREIGLFGFLGSACTIAFEQSDALTSGGGGGGSGGDVISGYDFSGYGQCRPLGAGTACPAVVDAVTEACLDRNGRTSYCSDCSVMCSVPVR